MVVEFSREGYKIKCAIYLDISNQDFEISLLHLEAKNPFDLVNIKSWSRRAQLVETL
jgi:hypothetical protein